MYACIMEKYISVTREYIHGGSENEWDKISPKHDQNVLKLRWTNEISPKWHIQQMHNHLVRISII